MSKNTEPSRQTGHLSDAKYSSTETNRSRPNAEVEAYQAGYRQGYTRAAELITETVIVNVSKMKQTIFEKMKIPDTEVKG
ncbi:MAG: hypothetical protein GX102_13750 [Porphyromonadaceae bacterium]|nr:hypothetical protein [Porphyromonadaceae bacterium]